jgi:hypothetical protein
VGFIGRKGLKKADIRTKSSWILVAHFCNPNYSIGSNKEDCGLKPAQANSSRDPISKKKKKKKTITKKGCWSGSSAHMPNKGEALNGKPQCHKKEKEKKNQMGCFKVTFLTGLTEETSSLCRHKETEPPLVAVTLSVFVWFLTGPFQRFG